MALHVAIGDVARSLRLLATMKRYFLFAIFSLVRIEPARSYKATPVGLSLQAFAVSSQFLML
jgi:hypothetical protein